MIHYVIIVIAIIVIICTQFFFFNKNRLKLKELETIFPKNINDNISTIKIGEVETIKSEASSYIFSAIITTINDYLVMNKGAASDFHLIKDVVERNCDSVEEEISTLTPIPLYFGLVGTMFGILVGVGFLVFNGGLDSLLSSGASNTGSDGISELLGGVALAMISSISGILLTTAASYFTKGAKTSLNGDKNAFLSWIQVKLLPSLSNNATTAIYALQQNLTTFNNTFSSNIVGMNDVFLTVGQSHKDQLELMRLVDRMDVTKMAKANVQVLQEFQKSTGEFERFNEYLHNVSSYLHNVQKLNVGINEHLNRTHLIEEMGVFFKSEIEQIEGRKGVINNIVGNIDQTLHKTILSLQENTDKQLNEFIQHSVSQQDRLTKTLEEHEDKVNATIIEQRDIFNQAVEEQSQTLKDRLQETSAIIEELKNLGSVKVSMRNIETSASEQNKKISDLTLAITQLAKSKSDKSSNQSLNNDELKQNTDVSNNFPICIKILIIAASVIVGVAGLLYITVEVTNMINIPI